jgi:peptidoglycan/LPS O-acetylase OafA/YrhL
MNTCRAPEAILTLPEIRPTQQALSTRYMPTLDGARGIAILLVLAHHFRFLFDARQPLERPLAYLLDGGWCGVQMFFVLSGFLITGILLDTKGCPRYLRTFYARRALRIFPLYYGYLAFVFIGLSFWWKIHFHHDPWRDVNPAWYLAYIENFKPYHMFHDLFLGHLWSLAIEEQFYLVWPFLVLALRREYLGFVCFVAIATALVSRLFLAGQGMEVSFFSNTFTLSSIDSLCAGSLLAILFRTETLKRRFKPWIVLLAIAGALGLLAAANSAGTLFLYNVPMDSFGISCLTVLFTCLVYSLAMGFVPTLQKVLSWPPLRSVGRVSYGMYVLHPVIISLVVPQLPPISPALAPITQLLIKVTLCILLGATTFAIALLSWRFWEQPFLRLKNKFHYCVKTSPAGSLSRVPVGA